MAKRGRIVVVTCRPPRRRAADRMRPDGNGRQGCRWLARELPVQVRPADADLMSTLPRQQHQLEARPQRPVRARPTTAANSLGATYSNRQTNRGA